MKYLDSVEVSDKSTPYRPNWTKLVIKPFAYGVIFGLGCYIGSVFVRTSVMK
jgi:hypothetical protein